MKTGNIIWVKRGEETPPTFIRSIKASVRIWGVVRWSGKIFDIVKGREHHEVYIRWLSTHLASHTHKLRGCMFIHDHCSWHQPVKVKEWLEEHGLEAVLNPVKSPEFNAIEYVWAWINSKSQQIKRH